MSDQESAATRRAQDKPLLDRFARAKFSWSFTREVLRHGRWKSLRQAVRNFKNRTEEGEPT
jgi:hypothetical protein